MDRPETRHVPVMTAEVLEALGPGPGGVFVDATLGGGGHTRAIAERVGPNGEVVALDRDPAALERCEQLLAGLPVRLVHTDYAELPEVLDQLGIERVDGVLMDLGLSSDQLADDERGFSFSSDGPLDLRFDPTRGEPASRLVERMSEGHLADLIYAYGEERYSRRIARAIVARRKAGGIRSAKELAETIYGAVPAAYRRGRIDAATRTFQALRIAVNEELKSLETALKRVAERVRVGGRLAVISFHSLEDRLVKNALREDPRYEVKTRRPVRASEEEVARNPRARSAKLRVAERVK